MLLRNIKKNNSSKLSVFELNLKEKDNIIDSLNEEIILLKSIIGEKDKTINSLK